MVADLHRAAVFFDRDGTLNVDVDYLHRTEDFAWMPEAPEAVRWANEHGYAVIVITNQSGVARGMFPESDVRKLHAYMNAALAAYGAYIDAFYYCPHLPDGIVPEYACECECRKPKPGLLLRAIAEWHIDPAASVLLGDGARDVECAHRAGVRGVLYQGGSLLAALQRVLPTDGSHLR